MFVLLMPGAALNKEVFVAGSPPMNFLVTYFAPALQSGDLRENHWNPVR
jgi:hypothetical protein